MTVVWVFGGAAVLLLGLVIWAGHKMVTAPGAGSGGASDALGNFITKIGSDLAKMREADRPDKVIVVVLTDGQENMSQAWTRSRVKDLVKLQEDVYKWNFVFLGSNMDAVAEGASIGFSEDSSLTYNDDSPVAVAAAFGATSNYISMARSGNLAGASFSAAERGAANQE